LLFIVGYSQRLSFEPAKDAIEIGNSGGCGGVVEELSRGQRLNEKAPTVAGWGFILVGPHGLEPWTKGFYRFQLSLLKFRSVNQNFSCATDYLTTFAIKINLDAVRRRALKAVIKGAIPLR